MRRRLFRPSGAWLYAAGCAALLMLVCALFPGASARVAARVSIPALRALAAFSGRFSFPIIGIFIALALFAAGLFRPRIVAALSVIFFLFAALWFPLQFPRAQPRAQARGEDVFRLCAALVADLNAQGRQAIDVREALLTAQHVMRAPAPAKAARYPEWMRAAKIAGIFLPFTGEALVDATRHPAAIPFTAAHELAHMLGIADEGMANYLAYEKSVAYGGAFAYSAWLWALKYALARVENPGEIVRALDAQLRSDLSAIPSVTGVDGHYGAIVELLVEHMRARETIPQTRHFPQVVWMGS